MCGLRIARQRSGVTFDRKRGGPPPAGRLAAALHKNLGADVAGVQGAGGGGIRGALEDGAAVRENGHFVGGDAKAEKEFIVADVGDSGSQTTFQSGQVESAMVFVNLDRIAAAHGDVRLGVAMKVAEIAAGAGAAVWVEGNSDGLEMAAPDIAGDEAAMQRGGLAGEKFDSFGGFKRGDQIDDRAEDANGVAGFLEALLDCVHQASETWGGARANGHGQAVAADGGGVDPGLGILDGEVVDEETGFEVVGTVENEVEGREKAGSVAGVKIGNNAFDGDTGIDGAELAFSGDGFGDGGSGVRFVEERLALEIGRLDKITVDDANFPHAGADEEIGRGGTDRAASDDYGAGGEESLLTFFTNASE